MKKPTLLKREAKLLPKMIPRLSRPIKSIRPLLSFVSDEPNPIVDIEKDGTADVVLKREIDAVGKAFRNAAKDSRTKELHELAGYGAEYAVVVFQNSDQATAFFEAVGYPEPEDVYIDGLHLAELLKVQLPKSDVPIKKLKQVHNPKLTRLAKPL